VIKVYTEEEYNQAKSHALLKLKCKICDKIFEREKRFIKHSITCHGGREMSCCSNECGHKSRITSKRIKCFMCSNECVRVNSAIKKNEKTFCSHSCSATYYNAHKTQGTRRSKLEIYLENQLKALYPTLEIHYNKRDQINAELDFYIPSLKLAFELNGIFHYEPIYGANKLKMTQNNDQRKFQACLEKGIELCIVDSSKMLNFKEKAAKSFLDIFKGIIDEKLSNLN
jgi:hypothetical protein